MNLLVVTRPISCIRWADARCAVKTYFGVLPSRRLSRPHYPRAPRARGEAKNENACRVNATHCAVAASSSSVATTTAYLSFSVSPPLFDVCVCFFSATTCRPARPSRGCSGRLQSSAVRCALHTPRRSLHALLLLLLLSLHRSRQYTWRDSVARYSTRIATAAITGHQTLIMKSKDDGTDLDHHLNMMLEVIERLERNRWPGSGGRRWPSNDVRPQLMPMQAELRTLELWRSVMAECLATFLYVAVVCGAATSDASPVLGAAAASGFTMLALTVCLQNVSGN